MNCGSESHDFSSLDRMELFRAALDVSPNLVWIVDPHTTRVVEVNKTACEVLGYTREEFIGLPIDRLAVNATAAQIKRRLAYVVAAAPQTVIRRSRARKKNGTALPVAIRRRAVTLGGMTVVIDVARDMSERDAIETALRQSRAKLHDLLSATPAMIYSCSASRDDPQRFTNTYTSSNVKTLLGYDARHFARREFWVRRLHPDDRKRVLRGLVRLLRRGSYVHEYRFRHRDGSYRWIHDELRLICDEAGRPRQINGVALDVTETRRTQEALKLSEERFALFMKHLPDHVFIKDANGRYVYMNPAAENLLRVGPRAWLGRTDEELLGANTAREFRANDLNVLEQRKPVQFVESGMVRDELHYYLTTKFSIPDASGAGTLLAGVAFDITELKLTQRALMRSEQRLQRALEERSRLGRDLHDHVVQMIYAMGMKLEECQRLSRPDVAHRIVEVISNLNRVIQDTREYIAGTAHRGGSAIDVRAELARLVGVMSVASAPRLRLYTPKRPVELAPAHADHLVHVASEGISNAMRHAKAQTIKVVLRLKSGAIEIEIVDDGTGFDLLQVKPSEGGLSNMRARAHEVGGALDITSSSGAGTRVTLRIPDEHSRPERNWSKEEAIWMAA